MELSKYNILGKLKNRNDYYIVNLLSGRADIIEEEEGRALEAGKCPEDEAFRERGYVVDPEEEGRRYRAGYLDFIEARENSETQIFFVPTYACNFACSYCYQESYAGPDNTGAASGGYASGEVIDSFFRYIDAGFAGKSKYLTLFGGEPLLPGQKPRRGVEAFLRGASERGLDTAVVTNGYHLVEYLDLLERGSLREVQITLDGPEAIHDRRRPLKDGSSSFRPVVAGIDAALGAGLTVNLRVVVDKENLPFLPELAELARSKGWTGNPRFKTQLGRNYELHTCQSAEARKNILSRADLWAEVDDLIEKHPVVGEFHRPAYSVARFLADTGELPVPLYDSCPGCKTEWAFDLNGGIYSCTATVGKPDERLGSFYPDVVLDEELVDEWESRDVTEIEECRSCSLQLACGGGCASVAKNRTGRLHAPDCRPVGELLSLGLSRYFEE
ncbi:MAG: radical SAM protein [Spirochaetia bacterium]